MKNYSYAASLVLSGSLFLYGITNYISFITMISVVLFTDTSLLITVNSSFDNQYEKSNTQDKLLKDICSKLDIDYDSYFKIEEIVEENNANTDNKEE